MAQVQVMINGRYYAVACDDGQEAHVERLGRYLEQKVSTLVQSVGQVGDARLLLMAGLIIADELSERVETPPPSASNGSGSHNVDEAGLARMLDGLAARVEAIADALAED